MTPREQATTAAIAASATVSATVVAMLPIPPYNLLVGIMAGTGTALLIALFDAMAPRRPPSVFQAAPARRFDSSNRWLVYVEPGGLVYVDQDVTLRRGDYGAVIVESPDGRAAAFPSAHVAWPALSNLLHAENADR